MPPLLLLSAVTVLAVLVHGYHLGVDDSAIYVPAVKNVADPSLYPFGAQFFLSHAHLSIFSALVGGSTRLSHLSVDTGIFIWHVASILLLMVAAWQLLGCCFQSSCARWGGVALLAVTLSVPVTGTALLIMDPYLTARSLSTPATLFAIAAWFSHRPRLALLWLVVTAVLHPQMACYVAAFLGVAALLSRGDMRHIAGVPVFGLALPVVPHFERLHGAARACLLSRTYFFVSNWAWYEWIGVFAPLVLLYCFSRFEFRATLPAFRRLAGSLVPYGLLFTAAALLLAIPASLESFNRLQPMRAFHLVYLVMFLLLGGLAGEYLLHRVAWRWAALLAPIALGMAFMQVNAFPASAHVELPGRQDANTWVSAFLWIRGHTPKDAVFALDPNYMMRPGEDAHGFRAVAERSVLADNLKDSGAVSVFPSLADEWEGEVQAEKGLDQFQLADFRRLAKRYPVTWIVTRRHAPAGLSCPYVNQNLAVCRIAPI